MHSLHIIKITIDLVEYETCIERFTNDSVGVMIRPLEWEAKRNIPALDVRVAGRPETLCHAQARKVPVVGDPFERALYEARGYARQMKKAELFEKYPPVQNLDTVLANLYDLFPQGEFPQGKLRSSTYLLRVVEQLTQEKAGRFFFRGPVDDLLIRFERLCDSYRVGDMGATETVSHICDLLKVKWEQLWPKQVSI